MADSASSLHQAAEWHVFLFGTFRLVDPFGKEVQLSTRKVEGLLAVLMIHRQYGKTRDEVAEILWPGRPLEMQRSNFRQALAHLRKSLGEEALETSRVNCRLSSDFNIQSDYEDAELRQSEAFMPNQEGDWFEEIRIKLEPEGERAPDSVVGNFLKTLSWFSENDSKGMFQLLRSSAALARGIAYRDMLTLLRGAGADPNIAGWSAYWRGTSEDDLELCARLLRFAFTESKRQNDSALASEVCLELGKVYSRRGQCEEAEDVCRMAETIAEQSGAKAALSNASWLKGTVMAQWTDRSNCFEFMERTEDLAADSIDRAVARSSRAFYLLSAGRFEEAHEVLQSPLKLSANLGHTRLEVVVGMTEAILSVHGGNRYQAIKRLEANVARCRALKSTQFRVYGEEILSKLYLLDGDRGVSAGLAQSAKAGRAESKMALTPLEARRLEAVSG